MIISIKRFIEQQIPFPGPPSGITYTIRHHEFDTATRAVVSVVRYENWYDGDPDPIQNFDYDGEFWHECVLDTTTRLGYVHNGNGGFTVVPDDNAQECGFDPANLCTLQLTGTVDGFTATGEATGAKGAVTYSLDGGLTYQAAASFAALALGDYTMTAYDGGVGGCRRTWSFTIAPPADVPFAPPANEPAGLDFSLHPRWHQLTVPAGAVVLLELYVESQHYQGDWRRLTTLRLRAGQDGRVAFRLDALLHRQLAAFVPVLGEAAASHRSRGVARNYFVRTARVNASSGLPGAWSVSAVRTVLRGGLPYEQRDAGWPWVALERDGLMPWLSWQPRPKCVTPAQPEWWSWLCPPGTPATVHVVRRYERANEPVFEAREAVAVAPAGQATPYRVLAAPLLPGAVPGARAVTLRIETPGGQPLSEAVRFRVETEAPRTRYFLFSNSVGGCDTLCTTGRLTSTLDTKEELAQQLLTPATPARAAQAVVVSAEATRRRKVHTGHLTAAQWAWLAELVLGRERWEATGPRLLPVLLGKASLAELQDERPLAGWSFEYEYAFDITAYAILS